MLQFGANSYFLQPIDLHEHFEMPRMTSNNRPGFA